jgi:hypothetical protein
MKDYDSKIIPVLDDIIDEGTVGNDVTAKTDTDEPDELTNPAENNLDLFGTEPGYIISDDSDDSDDSDPEIGAIDTITESEFDEFQFDDTRPSDFAATPFSALHTESSYEAQIAIGNSDDEAEIEVVSDTADIRSALIDYHNNSENDDTGITADTSPATDSDIEQATGADTSDTVLRPFEPTAFIQPSALDTADRTSLESSFAVPAAIESMDNQAVASKPLESVVDDIVKQLIPDLEQQLRFLVQQALEDRLPDALLAQLSNKTDHKE